ncbi:MAG: ATP-binding protein [Lachnospiraceae bacterium]|nr:ATP-binding protein [Lachnospiraceae bacterium]
MGYYLNSQSPAAAYKKTVESPYFVDKSKLIEELFSVMGTDEGNICLIRPRRFGKTVVANMIAAFFGKGSDSSAIFDHLEIAGSVDYRKYLNQHNVIYINFSKMPEMCRNYDQYISRITKRMKKELLKAYPDILCGEEDALWDIFSDVFETYQEQFIFVIDEWDCIFHKDFITAEDRRSFIEFLANLLKDQPYILFTYMTGVLPIAKYSSGSTINNFKEYDMATKKKYGEYFGFTQPEVERLYQKYLEIEKNPEVSLEELRLWYDGYQTAAGDRLYNPRSVVYALSNNQVADYWTSSGPYAEISDYIIDNVDGVKEALIQLVQGEPVSIVMKANAATASKWRTKDEVLSSMVVYGFLTYDEVTETVCIPNKELRDEFDTTVRKEPSLHYLDSLARESKRILRATLEGDARMVEEIMEFVHNTETPILNYNNENELAAVVNLAYLGARDYYEVEREAKSGKGYVDVLFLPRDWTRDGIIVELKVDHSAEEAIQQIKDNAYALKFKDIAGNRKCKRIIEVGINYISDSKNLKDKKRHQCIIEVLE